MDQCFNLSTVVDLAAGNSVKGVQYYRRMQEMAEDSVVREIFHRLAEEEGEEQRALLKVARAEAEKEQSRMNEQTYCYLSALGDELKFPYDYLEEFKAVSPREALEIGIQAKKDAILLYHEFLKRCVSQEARNILLHLLESEQRNLLELRDYMREICPTGCKYPPKNGNTDDQL